MDSTHAFAGDTKAKSAHDAPSAAIPRVAPSTPTLSVPQSAGATPSASLLASPVEPISAGRIAPTNRNVDDFTSDEDDAQSVIEEAMQEEHQNAQQERVATRAQLDQTESGLMGSRGAFVRVWVWRVIKMLLLVGLLLVPTVVCEVYHTNDCRIQGSTPVWPITVWVTGVDDAREYPHHVYRFPLFRPCLRS